MEFPRGLIAIIGLLSLGICFDGATVLEAGPRWGIALMLLMGRLASIVGLIMRNRVGWFIALGFFGAIIAINAAVAMSSSGLGIFLGLIVPAGCFVYLIVIRDEFA